MQVSVAPPGLVARANVTSVVPSPVTVLPSLASTATETENEAPARAVAGGWALNASWGGGGTIAGVSAGVVIGEGSAGGGTGAGEGGIVFVGFGTVVVVVVVVGGAVAGDGESAGAGVEGVDASDGAPLGLVETAGVGGWGLRLGGVGVGAGVGVGVGVDAAATAAAAGAVAGAAATTAAVCALADSWLGGGDAWGAGVVGGLGFRWTLWVRGLEECTAGAAAAATRGGGAGVA